MTSALDDLFPVPRTVPSLLAPHNWPGVNAESTAALQKTLKDNHVKHHVYFNDKGFHNHAAHHLLAIWGLGASGPVIEAAYQTHVIYQRPAYKSPEPIGEHNFTEHLGEEDYYNAYLEFFSDELRKKGAAAVLEERVFAAKANFDAKEEKQPEMVNRLLEGLFHPLIHAGYGVEFGVPGVLAEGLAQAAVHPAGATVLIPPSYFEGLDTGSVATLVSRLPFLAISGTSSPKPSSGPGTHAFTILARILKDPQFGPKKNDTFKGVLGRSGEAVREYAAAWTVNGDDAEDVAQKIEQLSWVASIVYGVGGLQKDSTFNANFSSMHLVTSSLFLPSWAASISGPAKSILLRSYFAFILTWWISLGRPSLDFKKFYESASPTPGPPGPLPTPSKATLPSPSSPEALTPNPWLPIVQNTVVHPNEHYCKLQRALAHYARLYGTRVPGGADFAATELEGADKIDGTLFVRAAGLTANVLGWIREGEELGKWNFDAPAQP